MEKFYKLGNKTGNKITGYKHVIYCEKESGSSIFVSMDECWQDEIDPSTNEVKKMTNQEILDKYYRDEFDNSTYPRKGKFEDCKIKRICLD